MTDNTTDGASQGSTDRWENEGGPMAPRGMPARDDVQHELEHYGIVPVTLTVFDWGGYRYSNVSDAIAAAKRLPKQP